MHDSLCDTSALVNLYTLLQILSLSLFEKMPILQVFSQPKYKTAISDAAVTVRMLIITNDFAIWHLFILSLSLL